MRRVKVTLSYDGTGFHGWQVQPGLATIQGTLEAALAELAGEPVPVDGSGRTDAGVHALGQVAAFSIDNPIPVANLKRALNRLLPPAIRVLEVEDADADFHPRYGAKAKVYEYRIWRGEVCSPFESRYVLHHPYPLDTAKMAELAAVLEGTHDFSAFAAADPKDAHGHSKVRTIFSSRLSEEGDRLVYRVRGSGFLKHMVRLIMGTIIEGGKGNLDRDGLRSFLEPGCLEKAGPSVPAHGLFLVSVHYETPSREASQARSPAPADA